MTQTASSVGKLRKRKLLRFRPIKDVKVVSGQKVAGVGLAVQDGKFFHALYQDPAGTEILHGLPIRLLTDTALSVGLGANDLAERIGVSRSTFHRRVKKPNARLSPLESDALARYGMLMEKATETFDGDADAARQWLSTPQPGIGNAIPLAMAQTTPGFREVEKLLTRIDFGVYA